VAQLVDHLTLGFGSVLDLGVLGLSPASGSVLSRSLLEIFLSLSPAPPAHALSLSLSLSLSQINK